MNAMINGKEMWEPVAGYEGRYEVSSFGRVRNARTHRTLSQRANHNGYMRVRLSAPKRNWRVHHLVALAFFGEPPGQVGSGVGEWTVHHKDEDRTNNRADNLEWLLHTSNVSVSQHGGKRAAYGHGFTHGHAEAARCILDAGLRTPGEVAALFGVTTADLAALYDAYADDPMPIPVPDFR